MIKWVLTSSSIINSVIEHGTPNIHLNFIHHQTGEEQIPFKEDWFLIFVHNSRVHQRMGSDEVQHRIGKGFGVIHTSSRSRFRDFIRENW